MLVSDHMNVSAVIVPLILGAHNFRHLQYFIAGPITHAFIPCGAHDACCDGVVTAIAR